MFEFKKVCDDYEQLSVIERSALLVSKSVSVLAKLEEASVPGIDSVETLATFILGSIVSDGKVNEQEYILMYPALVKVFGSDFDFESIKQLFATNFAERKQMREYTQNLIRILDLLDEDIRRDVIIICLCVTSMDGRISLRERTYIKQLCK